MKSLLLSFICLTLAWDWEANLDDGVCEKTGGMDKFSTGIPNKIFYIITRSSDDIFDYGQCNYFIWDEPVGNVQNYTFYTKLQDGFYYVNDFIMTWDTKPGFWGKGGMADITFGFSLPFEVLDTDYETYYVIIYCVPSDNNTKTWKYFETYSIYRDFDDSKYYQYAYDRGYKDEELTRLNQNVEYCGEATIRTNY
jgi:hypothetical protein